MLLVYEASKNQRFQLQAGSDYTADNDQRCRIGVINQPSHRQHLAARRRFHTALHGSPSPARSCIIHAYNGCKLLIEMLHFVSVKADHLIISASSLHDPQKESRINPIKVRYVSVSHLEHLTVNAEGGCGLISDTNKKVKMLPYLFRLLILLYKVCCLTLWKATWGEKIKIKMWLNLKRCSISHVVH